MDDLVDRIATTRRRHATWFRPCAHQSAEPDRHCHNLGGTGASIMQMKIWTIEQRCPVCNRRGSITFEEPRHDQSGKSTRAIDASGCWEIPEDGKPVSRCIS